MSDAVFTPVFRETQYLHHVCSECGYKIEMARSVWSGVYFGDVKDIKFCPHCGSPVVRFSDKAIFEKRIDFEPLRIFYEASEEFERKCRWIYHCYISNEHREKIDELLPFVEKEYGWTKDAARAVKIATKYKTDWRTIKKLITEFGNETE